MYKFPVHQLQNHLFCQKIKKLKNGLYINKYTVITINHGY